MTPDEVKKLNDLYNIEKKQLEGEYSQLELEYGLWANNRTISSFEEIPTYRNYVERTLTLDQILRTLNDFRESIDWMSDSQNNVNFNSTHKEC